MPDDGKCFFCPLYTEAVRETARTADELAFWCYQAIWHRAALLGATYERGTVPPSDSRMNQAERQLEETRGGENRERSAHAEAPRDPGGT